MNAPSARVLHSIIVGALLVCGFSPTCGLAQNRRSNPASKIYVSDVAGDAEINNGQTVEELTRRSVYSAQGVVIDTKRPDPQQDRAKSYSTMVYSNGTGAFFDADTRVEIRRFVQEPFVPARSDNEVEPSISQTQAFVSHGTVGLCTSKLVAGSTMTYATALATVNIQGRKVVIEAEAGVTKISMLEGESTVRAGSMDMGGHTLHTGEQAIIRPTQPGQPNSLQIEKIPAGEMSQLDDKVTMACMAKRTVYFEVRGRQVESAFATNSAPARTAGAPFTDADGEIVAIPLVPTRLPVQFTISPASLITPARVVTPGNGTPTPGQGGGAGG
jgi:hypothetical protein